MARSVSASIVAAGLEAEMAVEGADEAAHGDQRRGDEHGADGDLDDEQHIAQRDAAAGGAGGSGFDDFVRIGAQHLADGNDAEEESAEEGEEQSDDVDPGVGRDGEMDGELREGLPCG